MPGEISVLVAFDVAAGKAAQMKAICDEAVATARTKDPGTLSFDHYFNAEERVLITLESHKDSESLLAHIQNATETVAPAGEITAITRLEIYGEVSEVVKDVCRPFNPTYYTRYTGL